MGRISSKRLAFLAKLDNPVPKTCSKKVRKYIDSYLSREYNHIIDCICCNFNIVKSGGYSAYDLFSDAILHLYSLDSLQFKNQSECDVYLEKELRYSRFIIKMKDVRYDENK